MGFCKLTPGNHVLIAVTEAHGADGRTRAGLGYYQSVAHSKFR